MVLGLNGAGKTTLLRILGGVEPPDTGAVTPGHGLKLGYYAQEHETLDPDRSLLENMRSAAPDLLEPDIRRVLGRHDRDDFTGSDLIVVSPGVPQDHPLLLAAKAAGVLLRDLRLANGIGGKGVVVLSGSLPDVQAAVAAGREDAQKRGLLARAVVIPRMDARLRARVL